MTSKLAMLGLALSIMTAGCNYNRLKDGSAAGPGGSPRDQRAGAGADADSSPLPPLGFQTIQAQVLSSSCVSCHSNSGGNAGGTNLETYGAVRAALARVEDRALGRQDMPPGRPLSARAARILKAWIDAGAPELASAVQESGDPELEKGPVTFAKLRDKVFARRCLDCHGPVAPQGGLDLTSAAQTRERATVIFDRVYVRRDMPTADYPALTPAERRALLQWFEKGMPD